VGDESPGDVAAALGLTIEVRRSRKRTRTVAAYIEGDTIVVMIPARMNKAEESRWVATMVGRLTRSERRRRPSDDELMARAAELSGRYLDGRARPASVRWVGNQRRRWGSCTPSDATIRLSTRLQGMPEYVIDYVLLHELTHLLSPGHGPDFWAWLERYPLTERARGFLDGVTSGARPIADDGPTGDTTDGCSDDPATASDDPATKPGLSDRAPSRSRGWTVDDSATLF
jgi:predicted metal-dependent hydrolase